MTVAAQAGYQTFNGGGTTGPFTFNFRFIDNSQIVVTKTTAAGTVTLVQNTDYTVAGAGSQAGGTVYLTVTLNVGESIMIRRVLPLAQLIKFGNFTSFFAETHEEAFDILTMLIQQLNDTLQLLAGGMLTTEANGSGRLFSIQVTSLGIDDNGVEEFGLQIKLISTPAA